MKLLLNQHIIADEAIQDGSKLLGWYPQGLADGGLSLTRIDEPEFSGVPESIHTVIITREDIHKLKQLGFL